MSKEAKRRKYERSKAKRVTEERKSCDGETGDDGESCKLTEGWTKRGEGLGTSKGERKGYLSVRPSFSRLAEWKTRKLNGKRGQRAKVKHTVRGSERDRRGKRAGERARSGIGGKRMAATKTTIAEKEQSVERNT